MPYRRLIIDGYSLMHRIPGLAGRAGSNLAGARQRLIQFVERTAHSIAETTTIVFDGQQSGGASPVESTSIEVIFAPADRTADTIIEQMVHDEADREQVLVVASDRLELENVSAAGALAMSCDQYLDLCRQHEQDLARKTRTLRSNRRGSSLGDFFPDS